MLNILYIMSVAKTRHSVCIDCLGIYFHCLLQIALGQKDTAHSTKYQSNISMVRIETVSKTEVYCFLKVTHRGVIFILQQIYVPNTFKG